MKTIRMKLCRPLFALGLACAACDDVEPATEDAGTEDAAEDERGSCWYSANPPATDDSDSIIGGTDDVESEDAANGGCDLHMFRVTANPPADRARTVTFEAVSPTPFDDYGAMVWSKSCAGGLGGMCAANFSTSAVTLEAGGGCIPGPCIYCPPICSDYTLEGTMTLSATNSVADLRAGMRATDEEGNPVVVNISVSE
jgi:hypothetical protein